MTRTLEICTRPEAVVPIKNNCLQPLNALVHPILCTAASWALLSPTNLQSLTLVRRDIGWSGRSSESAWLKASGLEWNPNVKVSSFMNF